MDAILAYNQKYLYMKIERKGEGVLFKNRFIPVGGGLYDNTSDEFFQGALPGISRAIKCDGAACVCVEQSNINDMAKIYRIRKLTPREAFRLMGVSDSDIDKIQADGISESQQYKLAGNSIVVDVMTELYDNLFFGSEPQEGENYMQLFYD